MSGSSFITPKTNGICQPLVTTPAPDTGWHQPLCTYCNYLTATSSDGTYDTVTEDVCDFCREDVNSLQILSRDILSVTMIQDFDDLKMISEQILKSECATRSWFVNMMLQKVGRLRKTKISSDVEQFFKWEHVRNILSGTAILEELQDAIDELARNCAVNFDSVLMDSYPKTFEHSRDGVSDVQRHMQYWTSLYLTKVFEVSEVFWVSCETLFKEALNEVGSALYCMKGDDMSSATSIAIVSFC